MQAQVQLTYLPSDSWIVDTCASHHMIADVNALQQVNAYKGTDKITIGNGQSLPIHHIGSAKLHTLPHSLILRNMLHVPIIADKVTKAVLYQGRSNDGELFKIPTKLITNAAVKYQNKLTGLLGQKLKHVIWHQRCGHPSNEVLSTMLKQS
ncbi:hypothetical protein FF1_040697 [Malus domestica]